MDKIGKYGFEVKKDGNTSVGDYSNASSFGKAFSAAHNTGGNGHTFKYND